MNAQNNGFDEHHVLHELKHFLPAQAPLKDFIHHNTLHSFQNMKFYKALRHAFGIFGYHVSLTLKEYRAMYASGKINDGILERIIEQRKGKAAVAEWKDNILHKEYNVHASPRIGTLRANWKRLYKIDMDSLVLPLLF